MPSYRLMCMPVQFWNGVPQPGWRQYDAASDADAIILAEQPPIPLRFIMSDGASCASVPRELTELSDPPRLVKRW